MEVINGNKIYERINDKDDVLYILLAGTTKISTINGISAAGESPELTKLTPVLDSEIIYSGKCLSYNVIPMTSNGIPTPAIITRASNEISKINTLIIDSGLMEYPKIPFLYTGLKEAKKFSEETALKNYENAVNYGEYIGKLIDNTYKYIFIAESVPGGTTTAYAVLKALGYDYMTSSSLKDNPGIIKNDLVEKAFKRIRLNRNDYNNIIKEYGDYMMALSIGISRNVKKSNIIYSGGTQMANVYLLDKLINRSKNRYVFTTKYIMNDDHNLMKNIVNDNVMYSNTDFSGINGLKYYENGYVKEGTGFGATFGLSYIFSEDENMIYDNIKRVYNSFLN